MGKEVALHVHDEILLNYKKQCIWVSFNEVHEPRAYYTEWSNSERERQILYINTYMWNLEWWYWQSYVGSKGDTDIKNRLVDLLGEGEGGWFEKIALYITICKTDSGSLMYNAGNPKLVLCDNWRDMVGKEVHGGLGWRGHIYL